jgi:hypothetical protein
MVKDGAQFQTEPAVRRQQGIAGDFRSHLTIAQDEVGENREHGSACRALEPPDRDPTQPNARIMGVTREAPTTATGGLVEELKAQGQEKGEDAFDKRLPIIKQAEVGGFVMKIDSDGTVFSPRFGRYAHVAPLYHSVSSTDETQWGEHIEIARPS